MNRSWFQSTIISMFVFFMMWIASIVSDSKLFTDFDAISSTLKEFELTDIAFSRIRPDPNVDERIVLVNIGSLSRRELAAQIQLVSQYKPRVIGFDSFLDCEGGLRDSVNCPQLLDTLGNLMLANAIREAGNVVMAEKLMQTDSLGQFDTDVYDSLEVSDPIFTENTTNGFVSLPTDATYQEDVKLCRSIFPYRMVRGKRELAFSVMLAMLYDSAAANKFLARGKEEEIINFRGNIEVMQLRTKSLKNNETAATNFATMFYVVDWDQIFRGEVLGEMFKDRIVIMGYLGDYLGDSAWEDKFYTPLNKKAGRANPDMFGPVVHANATAMILNGDYVDEIPDWSKYLIAFVVCFLTVSLFIWMDKSIPMWFDAMCVVVQLVEIIVISFTVVYAFAYWSLKLDLTLAIAVSAFVGPCYDFFKSGQNEVNKRLTKRRERVLTQ